MGKSLSKLVKIRDKNLQLQRDFQFVRIFIEVTMLLVTKEIPLMAEYHYLNILIIERRILVNT